MTNLEFYKDDIMEHCCLCEIAWICKYGKCCPGNLCRDCEFNDSLKKCMEVILAEYKEPIKLKQWEKDLLETIVYGDNSYRRSIFYNVVFLEGMKRRHGHFRGVTDISMTIGEILDNCEVSE